VSQHLLPPAPCADADEERFLLDAARFLVKQGLAPEPPSLDDDDLRRTQHCSARDAWEEEDVREDDMWDVDEEVAYKWYHRMLAHRSGHVDAVVMLVDLSFFLDAQLRAAEARGQPLRDAFSFSGRTLASVTRLAAEHRRNALVAAAEAKIGSSDGGMCFDPDKLRGVWREPLEWDNACDQALALRCAGSDLEQHSTMRWPADVELDDEMVHGEWHMQRLRTFWAIRMEGFEQINCLRHADRRHLSTSRHASYWSLRFTPDAADDVEAHLAADKELRLTVEVDGGKVCEALARDNEPPLLAARKALSEWGRRTGVRVPEYIGAEDDEDEAA
jgi:hypothetical protein